MDLLVERKAPKVIQVSEVHKGRRVLPASRDREEHRAFKVILAHKDLKVTKEIKAPRGSKAIQEHRAYRANQEDPETPVAKVPKVTRETEALVSSSPRSTTRTPRGPQRQAETFQETVSSASLPEPYQPTIRTTVNYTSTPPQVVGHSRQTCRCQVIRVCPAPKVTKVQMETKVPKVHPPQDRKVTRDNKVSKEIQATVVTKVHRSVTVEIKVLKVRRV
jgi:hypothetical protein